MRKLVAPSGREPWSVTGDGSNHQPSANAPRISTVWWRAVPEEGVTSQVMSQSGRRQTNVLEFRNANERRASRDGCVPESEVVRDNDAASLHGAVEDVFVRRANEAFVSHCLHVTSAISQASDNVRADVLIGEKRELERLHAVILSSQVCSPFSA